MVNIVTGRDNFKDIFENLILMTTFDIEHATSNLVFNLDKSLVKRKSEFNDSLVTSKETIKPGQVFSIKVQEIDTIWDGNLRIGFTMLPDGILFPLARYSIPDMCDRGGSWICAIDNEVEMEKNSQRQMQNSFRFDAYQSLDGCNIKKEVVKTCKCCLSTSFGSVPIYHLMSECLNNNDTSCMYHKPGMVGSIISIYYEVESVDKNVFPDVCVLQSPDSVGSSNIISEIPAKSKSENEIYFKYFFHVLVNGIEVTKHEDIVCIIPPKTESFTSSNPYNYLPSMRAIVDVYGSTKSVQIMDFEQNKIQSLQNICVHEMIKNCGYKDIKHLPRSLKSYLQIQLNKLLHLKD